MRRDFNVGTATEAGNLVPTNLSTDLYVDALRAAMVVPQLGVRVLTGLSGNIDIPRKATPSALAGVTEIGSAAETNPTVAKLTLSPKRVSAYVEPSKQAIIQSAIALEGMIRDDLVTGAAVQIENYMIQGSSAANGTGLIYRSGLGTVTEQGNGTNLLWDHLVDVETAAAAANAEPDRLSGYLINTQTRGKAKKVQRGTNLPFIWENGGMPLNGYRAAVTNNVPSNLTKGTSTTVASALLFGSDWSMAVLGFFGGVDVTVDPFTKADTGQVKITLNQFWDYTVRQPAAIVVRKDILTT
jgi:HK97 family phage major capsid protein